MKGGNKQESPHGKVGDSVVDCLLLRYLSYRELYSMLKAILTHLVVDDSFPKSLNEFRHLPGIPSLIHEPSRRAFCQQFLRSPFDLCQRAEKGVDKGGRGRASDLQAYLVSSVLRFVSPGSPSIVDVVMACLNLSTWGLRLSIFSLTSLNSCHRSRQPCTTVVYSASTS